MGAPSSSSHDVALDRGVAHGRRRALLWWTSRSLRAHTGLPSGRVVYSDTGAEEVVEKPLRSQRYGLVGRPDYLLVEEAGKR